MLGYSNVFSLTLEAGNNEFSEDSVFSKEVDQPSSPINYVLMVIDNLEGITKDELELTEAKLFIIRLFAQGDYRHYADKFTINRDDLQGILYEATTFLSKKNISCTIALILKSVEDSREVIISSTGTDLSFIINSEGAHVLTPRELMTPSVPVDSFIKPLLYVGKLKKDDTLLLCSEILMDLMELNLLQRIVISSKGPQEVCKKLLLSVSGTGRKDNISIAVFNGSITSRILVKTRISKKTLLLIIIPFFLILIGLFIFNLSSVTKEKSVDTSPIILFNTSKIPSDSNSRMPRPNNIETRPINNIKDIKKEVIKKPEDIVKKYKNVKFIVNGSVVMISNWESVKQEILCINWEKGIVDNNNIHKYLDYSSIPSSVKVTYIDNSTKSYRIK